MENQFTNLELQLIRSSISTKTDEEIAAILERPVEDIHDIIIELTRGDTEKRLRDVQQHKIKQEQPKKRTRLKREARLIKKDNDSRAEIRKKDRQAQINLEHKRNIERAKAESKRKFSTRVVDYNEMITIRLDDKTLVQVKKGTNIDQIRKQYSKIWLSQQKNS